MPALDPADLDTTCAPCQHFDQFANGGWMKRATIPAAFSGWSSFNELEERNKSELRRILEAAAAKVPTSRDSTAAERTRAAPLEPELQNNEVGFPAGRVQPPFFHPAYDVAANYGGIGGPIGHEISHGFDDSGRQFDASGNLRDWWTADDAARFKTRADQVAAMYDGFVVLDSVHINGRLTLGENIADIAGVSIAFEALQRDLASGKSRMTIDGFTPDQRFFLAYAQARRGMLRSEQLRTLIATDPHSPGEFRGNGPRSLIPEFAKAFGCKAGDAMVRSDPLKIW